MCCLCLCDLRNSALELTLQNFVNLCNQRHPEGNRMHQIRFASAHDAPPDPLVGWWGETPSPYLSPFDAFGVSKGYWRQWADERFGDPPPRLIQEPAVVRDKDGKPPTPVHCFCVCSGSVLLGDLGVSRSREHDLLSVLFIYPRFFVYVQYVSSHSLSLFYSAIIWCMFVALV